MQILRITIFLFRLTLTKLKRFFGFTANLVGNDLIDNMACKLGIGKIIRS